MNKSKNEKNTERGQIMVEAIVALSIITIGIMGVFTLTSRSISLNRVTADRYVAVNLANEGIELVKNLIDRQIPTLNDAWNDILGLVANHYEYEIDYNDESLVVARYRFLFFDSKGAGYYRYKQRDVFPEDKETNFKRIITIKEKTNEHIEVVSMVTWESRGGSYDFSVKDDFYNLKMFKYNNLD